MEETAHIGDAELDITLSPDMTIVAAVDAVAHAMAIVVAGSQQLVYANPAFVTLCCEPTDPVAAALSLAGIKADVMTRASAIVARVSASRVAEYDVECTGHDDASQLAAWLISAWPVASAHGDFVAVSIRTVTEEAEQRRTRSALLQQLRDVNEQLLLATLREEDLRVQAEAASEAKSVFVATMSHELRTPLAAIIGYSELLHEGLTGPVNDAQRTQLSRVLASANHLLAIINDILTLSSADANRESLRIEAVDVHSLVEGTSTLVTPLMQGKELEFSVQMPAESLTVMADSVKLRQILVNLLGNAAKFTEHGMVELNIRGQQDNVVFEVRDSGIGIAPEHHERVFEAFWQARPRDSRAHAGTGLGLNVSRTLARHMNGDITVESVPGAGSTFRLVLPAGKRRHEAE